MLSGKSNITLFRQFLYFLCLALAVGMVVTVPVEAQTVPGNLSMHATIESVGVVAPYTGDNAQNNNATIWYRPVGTSVWLAGPEMFVDRSAREWRVSLVHLSPETEYEVQVRYTDPNGVTPATVSGSVRTRPDYPDVGHRHYPCRVVDSNRWTAL